MRGHLRWVPAGQGADRPRAWTPERGVLSLLWGAPPGSERAAACVIAVVHGGAPGR